MKISKEIKVGVFAITAGVILYFGYKFLKGSDIFSDTNRYYAVYDDIDGLTVSNPVMLNGVVVGRVEKIFLQKDKNYRVVISLEVDKAVVLGDSSRAILANSDLLGSKNIVLDIGKIRKVALKEDTLLSGKEQVITEVLKAKAMPVLDNLDSTAAALHKLIKEFSGSSRTVNATLSNLEKSSDALHQTIETNGDNITVITDNLKQLSGALIRTQKDFKTLLVKLNTFGDTLNALELKATVDQANKSVTQLNQILTKVNKGQGTLGKLVNNDSLHTNLLKASGDLDKLFIDVKANPGRYVNISVFGKKEKPAKK